MLLLMPARLLLRYCNTLQHTATQCMALRWHDDLSDAAVDVYKAALAVLQHAATCCNLLRRGDDLLDAAVDAHKLQHTATNCNTLRWGDDSSDTAVDACKIALAVLQHTVTHYNTP